MTPQNKRWGLATVAVLIVGGIIAAWIQFGLRPGADPEYRAMAIPAYDALYRAKGELENNDYRGFEHDLSLADGAAHRLEGRASDRQKSTASYRAIIETLNAYAEVDQNIASSSEAQMIATMGIVNHAINDGQTVEQASAATEAIEARKAAKPFDAKKRDAAGRASKLLDKAKDALDAKD